MKSDPIVAQHDFSRGFGVDRVDIIKKRRTEDACEVNCRPEN